MESGEDSNYTKITLRRKKNFNLNALLVLSFIALYKVPYLCFIVFFVLTLFLNALAA